MCAQHRHSCYRKLNYLYPHKEVVWTIVKEHLSQLILLKRSLSSALCGAVWFWIVFSFQSILQYTCDIVDQRYAHILHRVSGNSEDWYVPPSVSINTQAHTPARYTLQPSYYNTAHMASYCPLSGLWTREVWQIIAKHGGKKQYSRAYRTLGDYAMAVPAERLP